MGVLARQCFNYSEAVLARYRVAIVIPVYNGERHIRECLDSAISACGSRDVVVVVNDGSTDGTASILGSYSDRIDLIVQDNLGEASAVNRGFHHADADYVVVLNADDLIAPDALSCTVRVLEENPTAVVAYPDWYQVDEHGYVLFRVEVGDYSRASLVGEGRCLPGPGALIRKEALAGRPLRDPQYRFVGDYEAWLRLSMKGDFIRVPKVLACWRQGAGNLSSTAHGPSLAEERYFVMRNFIGTLTSDQIDRSLARRALANAAANAAFVGVRDRRVNSRSWYRRAIAVDSRRPTSVNRIQALVLNLHPVPALALSIAARLGLSWRRDHGFMPVWGGRMRTNL